ncbi:MAG: DUF2240 family protein [Promethearchaeota archaeon]
MMRRKFENFLNRIIEETGLTRTEIFQMVEEKKSELKGLISDEGALFIIAKELGIDIVNQLELLEIELLISDLNPNMRNIILYGRIKLIYPIHKFIHRDGREGFLGTFILTDRTGDIRVVLWNEHVDMFKQEKFRKNILVKIMNGFTKVDKYNNLEIHVGRYSRIILSPEDVDYKRYPKVFENLINIIDIKGDMNEKLISLKGEVIQIFPLKRYKTQTRKSGYLISINLMDTSGIIRITFWDNDRDKIQNLQVGDYIHISDLILHRDRVNNAIELYATSDTNIKKEKDIVSQKLEYTKIVHDLKKSEGLAHFTGYIVSIDDLRKIHFIRSGKENYVLNFFVADDSDSIRVRIWGRPALDYSKMIKEGYKITLKNVMVKNSRVDRQKEVVFLNFSSMEIDTTEIKQVTEYYAPEKKYTSLSSIDSIGTFTIKGFIAKEITKIFIYEACSICNRIYDKCLIPNHEREPPIARMIINLIIDDGTGTIRTAFMGRIAERLIKQRTEEMRLLENTPDMVKFLEKLSAELLGKDIIIAGRSRFNDYSNTYELIVDKFYFIDIDKLLEEEIRRINA